MEIIWIIAVITAFIVGGAVGRSQVKNDFIKMLKDSEVKIALSKHQGVIYAHDELTGAFLTRGISMEEISQKLSKLDGSKTFIAKGSDLKMISESDDVRVG